jgi:hypothetical protein
VPSALFVQLAGDGVADQHHDDQVNPLAESAKTAGSLIWEQFVLEPDVQ